jgi:alkaline phosphatase D
MKSSVPIILLALAMGSCNTPSGKKEVWREIVAPLFNPGLKPFYHGVASGDPLSDRVIIWTRITPDDSIGSIPVTWELASDTAFSSDRKTDTTRALATHDFTVKVDVTGLQADHIYYYRFSAMGKKSVTGRTKTTPTQLKDSLKFAIVTCSNWEWGYFNAFGRIADKPILDAVIHLGDYIYEYAPGVYGDTTIGRVHLPHHEVVTLADYRIRYSQYRLDDDLRRAHQEQPFIAIWDDHEIANNSYTEGAQNHQPEEGEYRLRKEAAKQAYFEWLPIREGNSLYRTFSFGSLAQLIMLDERLAGRTKQADSVMQPGFNNEDRTMLGAEQLQWFEKNLKSSQATWKIIGNQVLFSDVDLVSIFPKMQRNLDSWDGYPAEKKKIKSFILDNRLQNIVFVTGDTHASWAIEAATNVKKTYMPFAIELGTTSISSANGDEHLAADSVKMMESGVLKMNPHVKYLNDRDHGYLMLTLYPDNAHAEWYYVETLRKPDLKEYRGKEFRFEKNMVKLK